MLPHSSIRSSSLSVLVTHAAPVSRSLTQIQPFTSRRRSDVPVTPSSGVVWSVTPSHVRVERRRGR